SVSAGEVIEGLRESARGVNGIQAWFQPVQELGMEDRISRTQYQFTLSSPDSALLAEWSERLLRALAERPELADVAGRLQREGLQAYLEVDRDAAARLGLRMSDIASALQSAFGQRQVSTLFTHASQYRVVLESDDAARGGLQALEGVYVRPANGAADAPPVPLSALARAVERRAPLAIEHQGQFPAVTLSFNLAPGHSLGEAVAAI